jgi:hypothetical protein
MNVKNNQSKTFEALLSVRYVVFKLAHNDLQLPEVAGIFTTILDLKLNFN